MASSTRPSAPPETLLYFAFGSNLSSTQMRDRCPGSVPIGLGYLANWDFIINEGGFANAVPSATPRRATTYTSTSTPAVITSTSRRRRSTFLTTPYPPSSSSSSSPSTSTSTSKPQPRRRSSLDRPSPTSYTTTTKTTTTTTTTTPTTRDPNSGVYGILWQLPSQREKRDLDRHEGVPAAYEDLVMPVELLDREGNGVGLVSALVYVDRRRVAPAPPRDEYVVRMNRGIEEAGREWGFPGGYVEGVMRRFIPPPSLSPSPPVGVEGVEVGGSNGGGGGGGDGGVSVDVSGGGGGGGGGRGGGGGEASKDEEREGSGKRNRRRFSRGFW